MIKITNELYKEIFAAVTPELQAKMMFEVVKVPSKHVSDVRRKAAMVSVERRKNKIEQNYQQFAEQNARSQPVSTAVETSKISAKFEQFAEQNARTPQQVTPAEVSKMSEPENPKVSPKVSPKGFPPTPPFPSTPSSTPTKSTKADPHDSLYEKERHEIIDTFNALAETKIRYINATFNGNINARLAEGFTVEDFKTVMSKKSEWLSDEKMCKHFTPATLFGVKHFETYLNEKTTPLTTTPAAKPITWLVHFDKDGIESEYYLNEQGKPVFRKVEANGQSA